MFTKAPRQKTYIKRETVAFQEQLQVGVFAEDGVVCGFLYALLECGPPLADELVVESAKGVLFRDWGDDDARIIVG